MIKWTVFIYIYMYEHPFEMDDLGISLFEETSVYSPSRYGNRSHHLYMGGTPLPCLITGTIMVIY